MCSVGLWYYMKNAGSVKLHEQGTLSDKRYNELKSAQKMIKSAIKGSDLQVDIYDINSVPKDKFVYCKNPDGVYVEVKDLLKDTVKSEEFVDRRKYTEPFLRRIFRFIDEASGVEESPIEDFKKLSIRRYNYYMDRLKDKAKENFDIKKIRKTPLYELKKIAI